MRFKLGNIIGAPTIPTTALANGIWNINDNYYGTKNSVWQLTVISASYLVVAGGGGDRGGLLSGTTILAARITYPITVDSGGSGLI